MTPIRTILAAGAALLALTMLDAAEARAGWNSNAAYCHWYRQQAWNTGDPYWWGRWRRCMRGWDWD